MRVLNSSRSSLSYGPASCILATCSFDAICPQAPQESAEGSQTDAYAWSRPQKVQKDLSAKALELVSPKSKSLATRIASLQEYVDLMSTHASDNSSIDYSAMFLIGPMLEHIKILGDENGLTQTTGIVPEDRALKDLPEWDSGCCSTGPEVLKRIRDGLSVCQALVLATSAADRSLEDLNNLSYQVSRRLEYLLIRRFVPKCSSPDPTTRKSIDLLFLHTLMPAALQGTALPQALALIGALNSRAEDSAWFEYTQLKSLQALVLGLNREMDAESIRTILGTEDREPLTDALKTLIERCSEKYEEHDRITSFLNSLKKSIQQDGIRIDSKLIKEARELFRPSTKESDHSEALGETTISSETVSEIHKIEETKSVVSEYSSKSLGRFTTQLNVFSVGATLEGQDPPGLPSTIALSQSPRSSISLTPHHSQVREFDTFVSRPESHEDVDGGTDPSRPLARPRTQNLTYRARPYPALPSTPAKPKRLYQVFSSLNLPPMSSADEAPPPLPTAKSDQDVDGGTDPSGPLARPRTLDLTHRAKLDSALSTTPEKPKRLKQVLSSLNLPKMSSADQAPPPPPTTDYPSYPTFEFAATSLQSTDFAATSQPPPLPTTPLPPKATHPISAILSEYTTQPDPEPTNRPSSAEYNTQPDPEPTSRPSSSRSEFAVKLSATEISRKKDINSLKPQSGEYRERRNLSRSNFDLSENFRVKEIADKRKEPLHFEERREGSGLSTRTSSSWSRHTSASVQDLVSGFEQLDAKAKGDDQTPKARGKERVRASFANWQKSLRKPPPPGSAPESPPVSPPKSPLNWSTRARAYHKSLRHDREKTGESFRPNHMYVDMPEDERRDKSEDDDNSARRAADPSLA